MNNTNDYILFIRSFIHSFMKRKCFSAIMLDEDALENMEECLDQH